jgi:hypothetical protein
LSLGYEQLVGTGHEDVQSPVSGQIGHCDTETDSAGWDARRRGDVGEGEVPFVLEEDTPTFVGRDEEVDETVQVVVEDGH